MRNVAPSDIARVGFDVRRSGTRDDDDGNANSLLDDPWPVPSGASVASSGESLVLTLDDVGAWQTGIDPSALTPHDVGVPVADPKTLRVVLERTPAVDATPMRALLVGEHARVPGQVVVHGVRSGAWLLVRNADVARVVDDLPTDAHGSCGVQAPDAFTLDDASSLTRAKDAACVDGASVFIVSGTHKAAEPAPKKGASKAKRPPPTAEAMWGVGVARP